MLYKPGHTTIKDVAAAAGVSTQTVSRVINQRPDVSQETRKRVEEAIERLNYRPSALARSLIRQRSFTLGVVTAGLNFIGPSRTLSGITAAAEEAGYSLLFKEMPSFEADDVEPIFQMFLSHQVDGIIWAVAEVGENRRWVNRLPIVLEIPIVYTTMRSRENISVVSINNYLGGRMAVSHLLEQGYQHIAHITGPLDWWEARERMAAWKDVLIENGREIQDRFWVEGDWSPSSGLQALEKLYEQYPEMDAIFVANDQMALGVCHLVCKRGLSSPESLGIVGFDNIVESAYFSPSITTIAQDQYKIGKLTVEEIVKIIDTNWQGLEPVEPKSIMLAPTLVIRQSSLKKGAKGGESGR
jgi:DNA-binding LacI/PurR family transcriptional regulator